MNRTIMMMMMISRYNLNDNSNDFITPDVQDNDTKKLSWWQKLLSLIKWRRQKS